MKQVKITQVKITQAIYIYMGIIAIPLFQDEATRNSNVTDPFARYKSSYALNGASPKVQPAWKHRKLHHAPNGTGKIYLYIYHRFR